MIGAARNRQPAVRRQGDGQNPGCMPFQDADQFARLQIPQANYPVGPARKSVSAVAGKGDGADRTFVPGQCDRFVRWPVPDAQAPDVTAPNDKLRR